jgi:hypothetical protein
MSEAKAVRVDSIARVVQIYSSPSRITLGDLRKLVVKAEGLDDESNVTFDGVQLDDYFADVHFARAVIVREVIMQGVAS